ncbi:MAG TPA: creatininase family protein [Terracidiphilus sp.]|nr:creatininase family protein [Terracidiphilus sp.]
MLPAGIAVACLCLSTAISAQTGLSPHWEELTGPDFITAIHQAQGVCLLPFGILEKHGPHLPIGTDLFNARYVSEKAAGQEYAVIFPAYYFGQIAEARHQPGTISYSMRMQLDLLQETTDEMARNGCKKIVIVNGHGGNIEMLPFFAQAQLEKPHDYVVYVYWWNRNQPGRPAMHSQDSHAGEGETSDTMVSRPDLVHMDRAGLQSGADLHRLNLPDGLYTGIWWYARFPNHYGGDARAANLQLGEFDMKSWTDGVVEVIRAVKADNTSLQLQNQFFEDAKRPLDTKQ